MIIVDAHCDTVLKVLENNGSLYKNSYHLDLERLKGTGRHVQFFAAFIDPIHIQAYALKQAVRLIDRLYEQAALYNGHISICRDYNEIENALNCSKVAGIISIEDGAALQGELSVLRMFYRLGVRSICLTWNNRNEIADGAEEESAGGGLTRFGRELVREMNTLGMIIDVSHISEKGFWDVLELTKEPVIASHSNARSICRHRRNLTDDQIRALKKNGGVMGVNLYPFFLNDSGCASIKDVIRHIEFVASLAGMDTIGLGSDFDGIECTPSGIKGVEDIHRIFEELLRLNYPEDFIKKFAGLNMLRVIEQVL